MTRKRKERKETAEALISDPINRDFSREEEEDGDDDEKEEDEEEGVKGFFACYLLCSLCPRFKGHTYIGFTVNPRRRIRQHNGEITSGAWKTKRKRPWEMVLCIYGFPTNVSALQFEWAWQHPTESLCVRKAAASLKSHSGIANKIKLTYLMLTLPTWQSLKLTVNFFSTKYTKHAVGCLSLPKQMKVKVCPIDELPCYIGGGQLLDENNDEEDDQFEGDENENGHHDISLYNITKTAHDQLRGNAANSKIQLMGSLTQRQPEDKLPSCHVDPPLMIPVSGTMSLDGTVEKMEDDDSFRFSKENTGDLEQVTDCQLTTSTGAKVDQLPSTRIHNFSSEFRFRPQNVSENYRAQFSLIDSPVEAPCYLISSLVNTVEIDEYRNSLELTEDSSKLRQPIEQKLAITTADAITKEQPQSAGSRQFSCEFGFREQTGPSILRAEDHRVTFNLIDSPPSSNTMSLANEVATVEDKIPRTLFQESTSETWRGTEPVSTDILLSCGIEVINVLTPSSECTKPPFCRKKKRDSVRQEIIDLTNSPSYIHL